jgi:hypothetical protein
MVLVLGAVFGLVFFGLSWWLGGGVFGGSFGLVIVLFCLLFSGGFQPFIIFAPFSFLFSPLFFSCFASAILFFNAVALPHIVFFCPFFLFFFAPFFVCRWQSLCPFVFSGGDFKSIFTSIANNLFYIIAVNFSPFFFSCFASAILFLMLWHCHTLYFFCPFFLFFFCPFFLIIARL